MNTPTAIGRPGRCCRAGESCDRGSWRRGPPRSVLATIGSITPKRTLRISFARTARRPRCATADLLALSRARLVRSQTLTGLNLMHVLAPTGSQGSGDVRERAARLEDEPSAAAEQLKWVLPRTALTQKPSSPQGQTLKRGLRRISPAHKEKWGVVFLTLVLQLSARSPVRTSLRVSLLLVFSGRIRSLCLVRFLSLCLLE